MNSYISGLILVLACSLAVLGAGCACVGREWKTAAAQPAPTDDINGAWEGTWLSKANGHKGRLRCLMTKQGDAEYEARFHATFWKIFSARYDVILEATRAGERDFRLQGAAELGGLLGGEYRYQGIASPTRFSATYSSEKDHGTFEMQRVHR